MRKAARRVIVSLLVVAGIVVIAAAPFLLLTPRPPAPPPDIDSFTKLDTYLASLVQHETPPALDVTVMKNGEIVYARSLGVTDGSTLRPATRDTVYHYWSVTKLFTATAIMQLVEQGVVRLDDPVTRFLPGFQPVGPDGAPRRVTIEQLLTHTSGIRDLRPADLLGWIHGLNDPSIADSTLTRERLAPYAKLASEPGAVSAYSNAGYILLAAVAEAAAGRPFDAQVRERILDPLGMKSSDFVYRGDLLPRAAAGSHPLFHIFTPLLVMLHHDWFSRWVAATKNGRMWLVPVYTDYSGPTALIGTGSDLARFAQAFLNGGELDGRRILTAESVRQMLEERGASGASFAGRKLGIGWHSWPDLPMPFKGHTGGGPGFGAQLAIFPDRNMAIVILANDTLTDMVGLTEVVAGAFR